MFLGLIRTVLSVLAACQSLGCSNSLLSHSRHLSLSQSSLGGVKESQSLLSDRFDIGSYGGPCAQKITVPRFLYLERATLFSFERATFFTHHIFCVHSGTLSTIVRSALAGTPKKKVSEKGASSAL